MPRIKISPDRKNLIKSEDYGVWGTVTVGEFDWREYWGFVYEIKNEKDGRSYIGSKVFRFKVRTKKDGTNTSMSDWKTYTSSSKEVNRLLDDNINFSFNILSLHKTKKGMLQCESSLQVELDVLKAKDLDGSRLFYNGNILGEKFINVGTEPFSEERKRKIGENRDYSKGLQGTPLQLESYEQKRTSTWWNNGEESFFLTPDMITEGLFKGRLMIQEHSKPCSYCKTNFKTHTPHKKFCSGWCYNRYVNFKERLERYLLKCKEGLNYHNLKCKYKPVKERPIYKRILLEGYRDNPCKWCGEGIPLESARRLHCSTACRLSYKKKLANDRGSSPKRTVNCTVCGLGFEITRKDQHLCSTACRNKYKYERKRLKILSQKEPTIE